MLIKNNFSARYLPSDSKLCGAGNCNHQCSTVEWFADHLLLYLLSLLVISYQWWLGSHVLLVLSLLLLTSCICYHIIIRHLIKAPHTKHALGIYLGRFSVFKCSSLEGILGGFQPKHLDSEFSGLWKSIQTVTKNFQSLLIVWFMIFKALSFCLYLYLLSKIWNFNLKFEVFLIEVYFFSLLLLDH